MTERTSTQRRSALISSTVQDLPEHRKAAIDACLRVGVEPLVFETNSADGSDLLANCDSLFEKADIYIGILAFRYGFIPPGHNKSLTEIEYDRAVTRGIPRLLFLMSDDHPVRPAAVETGPGAEKLDQFKAVVRHEALVAEFGSPDELKAAIVTGLVELLREDSRSRKSRTALLLLPYSPASVPLREFLSEELENRGFQALNLGEILHPGAIFVNAIAEAIRKADIVVVDITSSDPNVMYELGYAHALKKQTLILAEADKLRIPTDLAGFLLLTYDKDNLEPLRRPLSRFLVEYGKEGFNE